MEEVGFNLVVPHVTFDGSYITAVVAIRNDDQPYLFFWQAEEEVEEVRNSPGQSCSSAHRNRRRAFQRIRIDTIRHVRTPSRCSSP